MLDTDGDTTADCIDGCPTDPGKTRRLGCGFSDVDSDGGSFANCVDGCPTDPLAKWRASVVAVSATSTRLRHRSRLHRRLPGRWHKTTPGICGCGVPDVDSGDLVADCTTQFARPTSTRRRRECGCGFSDVDTDGDTVATASTVARPTSTRRRRVVRLHRRHRHRQ
jgi:hypothetical protein